MFYTNDNLLLLTDVYKMGHMEQYVPGTEKVYSYLCARSSKNFNKAVFFGLQYYLKQYLTLPILLQHVDEFISDRTAILGSDSLLVREKMTALANLGYLPIEIKAIEEGEIVPVKNAMMTITNTLPEFYWVVGFVESLILKLWYPITVATQCYTYREVVENAFNDTVDPDMFFLKDFMVHDFGYRGDTTEEGAYLSGAAHLLSFQGSDTVTAARFVRQVYNADTNKPIMGSVPASEHSVMCSYGREGELDAYKRMLSLYPTGLVSIVSDTYSVWNVLTNFVTVLKDEILARDGKVVFRPDSGNPEFIICGDPDADEGTPEHKGCIRLLDEAFGHTVNSKGYKVLNPKVGLIYGDGMYLDRYKRTLARLKEMGYAANNLVIGVGGILRNHSRDTLGFAIKATYVEVNGEHRDIEKDPVTDPGKKSHKGLLALHKDEFGNLTTKDVCSIEEEKEGLLIPVFRDGKILKEYNFHDIRDKVLGTFQK
jgi:nicotinamide phosphoribosyltransferase